ncbi:rhomboid-related protein 4-like isoform X2 [Conger conger]|uniref:rhomboid-related protein 4-like isoform X2 n=1 Tax=Conger conger TaxID=82655 RepID=UPI002A59F366|nr:rhomboid-related protein 4-like isoform X2 [Conger conger]
MRSAGSPFPSLPPLPCTRVMGLLLLALQVFQRVMDIPPVTLAALGLHAYLFLIPLVPLTRACVSVQTCWGGDWRPLLLAPLHHAHGWHLFSNMVSLLWLGSCLERRLGGPWFAYLLSVFSLLTGVVYLLLEKGLAELTDDPSYNMQCAVSFSVLFGLNVVNSHQFRGGVTNVMGFSVANSYVDWLELILFVMLPGTFVGHLAGFLVGILYTEGPLMSVMKVCAGVLTVIGDSAGRRHYYSSSGFSGYAGTRSNSPYAQNERPQAHTPRPGLHPYTTGLSEEEEYEAAIRASMRDQGGATHESPAYGFHIPPPQPDHSEEIRLRRLQRFAR